MKPFILILSAALLLSLCILPGCTNKCRGVNCPVNGTCDPETGACMIDYCLSANCGAHGTCNPLTGACNCESGYEGTHCDTTWSAKFQNLAGWSASDSVISSTAGTPLSKFTYIPTVTAVNAKTVSVAGMSGFANSQINFTLTSPTNFTANDTDAANRIYTGSGTINGNSLNVNYTVRYTDATQDVIRATWTKN